MIGLVLTHLAKPGEVRLGKAQGDVGGPCCHSDRGVCLPFTPNGPVGALEASLETVGKRCGCLRCFLPARPALPTLWWSVSGHLLTGESVLPARCLGASLEPA